MMNNWLLNTRPKPKTSLITLAYFGRILMPNHWKTMAAWHEIQCLSYLAKSFTKSNDSILTYVKWLDGTWPHTLSVKLHLRDKRTKRHNGHSDRHHGHLSSQNQLKQIFPSHSLSLSTPLSPPHPFSHPIHLPLLTSSCFPSSPIPIHSLLKTRALKSS